MIIVQCLLITNIIFVFCHVLALGTGHEQMELAKAKVLKGTCPDMCPEKERYMRQERRRLTLYEIVPGSDEVRHSLTLYIIILQPGLDDAV